MSQSEKLRRFLLILSLILLPRELVIFLELCNGLRGETLIVIAIILLPFDAGLLDGFLHHVTYCHCF